MTDKVRFTLDGTLATLPLNEGEPVTGKRETAESDPRLVEYIEASRAGDTEKMLSLREEWENDLGLMCRFNTIDGITLRTMLRYEAEIRVLRQESRGWELMSDGYEALHDDSPDNDKDNARKWVRQGLAMLEKASVARKELEGELGI